MATEVVTKTGSSVGKNILLGTLGVIVGAGVIYLLGSLIIYFLDRGKPLLQSTLPTSPSYSLTGFDATVRSTAVPTGTTGTNTNSTNNTTTIIQVTPTPTSSTGTGSTGSSNIYQPMIVFVPQSQSGTPGTTTNNTTTTTNNTTNPTPTPDSDNNISKSLLSTNNSSLLDPVVQPALLTNPSVPVNVNPQVLPDNPLYGIKSLNRTLQDTFNYDPLGKTYTYLAQANDETLEGLTLLGKDISPRENEIAVNTFSNATDLIGKVQTQVHSGVADNSDATISLLNGMSNSLLFQQLLMLAAENINDNNIALAIEKIRIDHLIVTGNILSDVLNHSGNNLSILSTFVNGSLQTPVTVLHSISILDNLENTVALPVAASINVLQNSLISTLNTQLALLSHDQALNQLAVFVGTSPIRLLNGIETLDHITALNGDPHIALLTHTASDIAVNTLNNTLVKLPKDQQIAFFNHFADGNLNNLKSLLTLEAHLNNTKELAEEILSAKKTALTKVYDQIQETPTKLQNDPFIQHILSQPDIYDLALVNLLQQHALTDKANDTIMQVLNNAKAITLTNFVTSLKNGQQDLLPIPYTATVVEGIKNNLTPQGQYTLLTALNTYNQTLRNYVTTTILPAQSLTRYAEQLQTNPTLSYLTPILTTKATQPIITQIGNTVTTVTSQGSQPTTTIQQTVQQTVEPVTQIVPIVQQQTVPEVIQSVPQVVNTVNTTTQPVTQPVTDTINNVTNGLLH